MGMDLEYISQNVVKPEWIDHNNHLHDATYYAIFSDSVVKLFENMGFTIEYRQNNECTVFSLESHLSFLQELQVNERFYIDPYIYDYDHKRIHLFLTMYNEKDERAATYEVMMMAVSNYERKSMNFPQEVIEKFESYYQAQETREMPPQFGHVIGIPRK